jgi:hypothetical protein
VISEERLGDLLLRTYTLSRGEGLQTVRRNTVELVPLQLRKNVNDFLSLGLGLAWTLTFERIERRMAIERAIFQHQCVEAGTGTLICRPERPQQVGETERFEEVTDRRLVRGAPHFFADANLGLVRSGPALGGRGHFYPGRQPQMGFELYATWKF